jgi:hypothetical protein
MALTKAGTGRALVAGPRTNERKNGMQSIEIIRSTVAAGRHVTPGEIIQLSDQDAFVLIRLKKAVPVVDAPIVQNRETEIEAGISQRDAPDGKTATKGRPRKK